MTPKFGIKNEKISKHQASKKNHVHMKNSAAGISHGKITPARFRRASKLAKSMSKKSKVMNKLAAILGL